MFCPEEENKKEPEIEENKDVNEEPKKEGNVKKEIKRENDFKEIDINKFVLDLKDEGTLKSTKSKLIDLYDNIMKVKDLNIIHGEILGIYILLFSKKSRKRKSFMYLFKKSRK